MADAGLRGESLMDVCRGRVGVEAGTEIAMRLEMHLTGKVKILPERIDAGEFTRIARAEKDGGVLEVVRFLCEQMNELGKAPSIAQYLLEFASPEVCRSMQVHGFGFSFQQAPRQSNGKFFMTPARVAEEAKSLEAAGKPWQWYAMRLGKLTPR
jgi:hypothetical protein